jgi:mRNA interferase MazF
MTWTRWSTGRPVTSTSPASVREICLARLDKTRPVVVLTRAAARAAMTKVTIAPITSTVKGLSSEVPVGPDNGLEQPSVISLDNVVTIPADLLGRSVGFLTSEQEALLAKAVVLAYDLDIALLDT